ncbi:hypothetical protein FOZG_17739 [Fusarium oxysporum Fo47]|uniref:Uncharacterized protein n=2 Tax=Fusarium oxysporum TaxID=5507 RepID=W9J9I7_FUSOX|nr:hypothetical protein FOZG_17739 [Fusarium oxysporum Fo47]
MHSSVETVSVKLNLEPALSDVQLGKGVVAVLEDVRELDSATKNDDGKLIVKTGAPGLPLVPDHKYRVSVYCNYNEFLGESQPIAKGDLTLTY